MNNLSKLLNDFTKAQELERQIAELRTSVNIEHDIYTFCYHIHCKHPEFSAWIREIGSSGKAEFIIIDGDVFIASNGQHDDETAQEMQQVIQNWLSKDND